MKKLILSGFVFLAGSWAIAQEYALDPFERKPAAEEAGVSSSKNSIIVMVEFVEARKEKTQELLRATPDTKERWASLQKWISSGEARILDTVFGLTNSGHRLKLESIYELNYPTRRLENSAVPEAPLFPTAFDFSRHGITMEVDPVLVADGTVQINLELNRSEFSINSDHPDLVESGEIQKGDFIDAVIEKQSVKQLERHVKQGERRLLGTFAPLAADRQEQFSVLAFVRWGKSKAIPLRNGVISSVQKPVKLRFEWIEVSSGIWHELSLHNQPSLLADESWKTVSEWLKENKARTLQTLSFDCASGYRTRMGTGNRVSYYARYEPPSVPGGASMPGGREFRNLGAFLEIDPEMRPSGIVSVNLNPEIASHCTDIVYYRRKAKGKWIPTVQMPLNFCNRINGGFSVGPFAGILAGVFTPPAKEIGKLDISRKILLYIHNDTQYIEDEQNGGNTAP